MITVNRRYRFSASHRLNADTLTADENASLYGKCNNPYGHGHDYVLEIGCAGPLDANTGLILPLAALDYLVHTEVLRLFAGKNINLDVPAFRNLVATTENIAQLIAEILEGAWQRHIAGPAQLVRVHVRETDRNSFEVQVGNVSAGSRFDQEELLHV